MHPIRTQRVDGNNRRNPGIDAARQAKHNAGETVLVHIVAQAQHHCLVEALAALDPLGHIIRCAGPAVVGAIPFGQGQVVDELL